MLQRGSSAANCLPTFERVPCAEQLLWSGGVLLLDTSGWGEPVLKYTQEQQSYSLGLTTKNNSSSKHIFRSLSMLSVLVWDAIINSNPTDLPTIHPRGYIRKRHKSRDQHLADSHCWPCHGTGSSLCPLKPGGFAPFLHWNQSSWLLVQQHFPSCLGLLLW